MNVKTNGNEILINGLRGPLKEPFESKIIPDNQTYTDVDLGRIGGIRKTLAEFKVQIMLSFVNQSFIQNIIVPHVAGAAVISLQN